MKVRKIFLFVLTIFMFASFSYASDIIKVGAVFDLTGPASVIGDPSKKVSEMMIEELNAKGGIKGKKIDLIIYDSASDPTKALLAVQRLIKQDKVEAIIGPTTTTAAMAVIPTVEGAKVPMIACVGGTPVVVPVKKWVFKTPQTDAISVERTFDYMKKTKVKKIAILTATDGFGDSGRGNLIKMAPSFGIEIVADEKFSPKDSDMTSQLTKIRSTDAQAVVVWTIGPAASIIAKNFKQLGIKKLLFQSHGVADPEYVKLAKDAAEGSLMSSTKFIVAEQLSDKDPQKKLLLKVKKAYEKKYGNVSTHTAYAWDALEILFMALEKAGTNSEKLRDAIENTKKYVGLSGVFNMSANDHNGLAKDSMVIVKVEKGGWVLVDK